MDKLSIRQNMIKARLNMTEEEYQVKSCKIMDSLLSFSFFNTKEPLGIYVSMSHEVETIKLIEYCFNHQIPVALPRVQGKDMNFYYVDGLNDLEKSRFGVMEPKPIKLADNLKTLIVPLVAFNECKDRIGYGKGYYDRYIDKYHPLTVGIAFELQKKKFKAEKHDQPLDFIVTENCIYK